MSKPEWHEVARAMHSSGMRQKEIAETLGKRVGTVWKALHPAEVAEATARYREENLETLRAKNRDYARAVRRDDPERERRNDAAFAAAHPGYVRTYTRMYRTTHPEYVENGREGARERYRKNKARCSERHKLWVERNPDYFKEYARAHIAENNAKSSARRAHARSVMKEEDRSRINGLYREARETRRIRCYLCGGLIPIGERHVDHIVPLAKGGMHSIDNLAVACAQCNRSKGAKLPEEVGLLL